MAAAGSTPRPSSTRPRRDTAGPFHPKRDSITMHGLQTHRWGESHHVGACKPAVKSIRPVDEGTQLSQDVAYAVKKQAGCQSFLNLGDRSTGRSVAISIWDTEEHARFSAADVLGDIVPRVQALGAQVDQPEFYEVIVS
jgi:hypothetical protein